MNTPAGFDPDEEKSVVFDISPQLEAELLRRAREKGTDPPKLAAEILEEHAQESGDTE